MYHFLLVVHGTWRWVVLLTGLLAIVRATAGRLQGEAWLDRPARAARIFAIALDIQVLFGASLLLVFGPLTTSAHTATIALPSASWLGQIHRSHALSMFSAFLLVHLTSTVVPRLKSDRAQYACALGLYGVALAIMLIAIPWERPLLRF